MSTRVLGKGTNRKLKSVTIIHSATTETVRLPEDNNGVKVNLLHSIFSLLIEFVSQVIVHTAIRTKVPLKKKVRGERSSKSRAATAAKSKSASKTTAGLIQAATVATATTTQAFKRQATAIDNAKKLAKKKKRLSAALQAEEPTEQASIKPKKSTKTKSSSKHKEIIDYSSRTANNQSHTNTFGKVQKWLLESPVTAAQQTADVEHTTKVRQLMTKSQSTPERLTQRAPKKSTSIDNMNDKVKLQVVYKPPFKFSLKLSKNSAVKTKVIGGGVGASRSKRKNRPDKIERGTRDGLETAKPRRTALLIRSAATVDEIDAPTASGSRPSCSEDQQHLVAPEPNYETLNPKVDGPAYENINLGGPLEGIGLHGIGKADGINTATFRINKSASGSNILANPNKYSGSSGSHSNTSTVTKSHSSGRGSSNNLNQMGTIGSYSNINSSRGSTMNLSKQFGSSQNLIRSSTTNLSKSNSRNSFDMKRGFYDMSRSSTTNLSKDHRHGSHLNLLKHQHLRGSSSNVNSTDDISIPTSSNSRSRRSSSTVKPTDTSLKANIPRVPSNSNLKSSTQRRSSISNIPRASLNSSSFKQQHAINPAAPSFSRQTSLQTQPSTSTTQRCVSDYYPGRPHTADANNVAQFEWPQFLIANEKRTKNKTNEPLPSDLEVMVSDIENLVNDNDH